MPTLQMRNDANKCVARHARDARRGHQQRRETQMDSAFATAPYPAYTTNELHAFVAAGRGNPVMLAEIARRAARDAGDTSVMTPGERLRRARGIDRFDV